MTEQTLPTVDMTDLSDAQVLTALHEAIGKASDTTERLDQIVSRDEDLRGEVEDGHLASEDPRIEALSREDDAAWGAFWAIHRECEARGLDTTDVLGF